MCRNRYFLKLAKFKLRSLSTEKEVEALYKQQGSHPIPFGSPPIGGIPKIDKKSIASSLHESKNNDKEPSVDVIQLLRDQRKDMDSIQKSLDELHRDVSLIKASDRDSKVNYASEEDLETLIDTVATIQGKVTDFESLRVELRILRERIKFLEENNATQSSHTITGWTQSISNSPRLAKFPGSMVKRAKPTSPEILEARQPLDLTATLERSRTVSQNHDAQAGENVEMTFESTADDDINAIQKNSPQKARSNSRTQTVVKSPDNDEFSNVSPAPPKNPASTPSSLSSAQSSILVSPTGPITPVKAPQKEPGSALSLNSHKIIPGSDPEDEDYEPNKTYPPKSPLPRPDRSRGSTRGGRSGRSGRGGRGGRGRGKRRSIPGLPLPDPEWERADWDGATKSSRPKNVTPNSRGRGLTWRADGGRIVGIETEPKRARPSALAETYNGREAMTSAEASPTAEHSSKRDSRERRVNSEGIPLRKNGLPDLRHVKRPRDEEGIKLNRMGEPDGRSIKRVRDDQGVLIKPNGEPDMRSAKAKKE